MWQAGEVKSQTWRDDRLDAIEKHTMIIRKRSPGV